MKSLLGIITLMAALTTALAADQTKNASPAKSPPAKSDKVTVQKDKDIELTGSRIKRPVRRSGRITDGPSQVVVIDRDAIERSGGATLSQVLAHEGIR